MSKYTISIDELLDIGFDFQLDEYKIFDEEYRPILNNAIIEYYRYREIAWTNPNQWRNRLKIRMNQIMREKYNALYSAKMIEFNPLFNVDMTETFTHIIDHTSEGNNNVNEIVDNTNKSDEIVDSNNKSDEIVDSNNSNDVVINANGNINNVSITESSGLNLTSNFPSEEMTENDYTNNVYVDGATKNTTNNSETNTSDSSNNTNQKTSAIENNTRNVTEIGNNKRNVTEIGNNTRNVISNDNTNNSTKESYERKTVGSSAGLPFSRAMQQLKDFYDDYLLDSQVIAELKDLFITVW